MPVLVGSVVIVGGSVLLALAGVILVRRWVPLPLLEEQNDVAGFKHEVFSILAVNPDMEFALDDIVIKNHVRRWPECRCAVFWCDASSHTPWREEIGVQEHAASQMRHS